MQIRDLTYHGPDDITTLLIKGLARLILQEQANDAKSVEGVLAREDVEFVSNDHLVTQRAVLGRVH